jgi:hypothetical protein
MIRCDKRIAAAVYAETSQGEVFVVVEMIEVKNRENTRIRPPVPQKPLLLSCLEGFSHESRGQATRPFIEVAHNNSGSYPIRLSRSLLSSIRA